MGVILLFCFWRCCWGLGFAGLILSIVAATVLIFWLVGFGLGRGHAEGVQSGYPW